MMSVICCWRGGPDARLASPPLLDPPPQVTPSRDGRSGGANGFLPLCNFPRLFSSKGGEEIILVVLILVPLAPICSDLYRGGTGRGTVFGTKVHTYFFNIFALEVQFLISHSQNNLTPNCVP